MGLRRTGGLLAVTCFALLALAAPASAVTSSRTLKLPKPFVNGPTTRWTRPATRPVVPAAAPALPAVHPFLILTADQAARIRARIAAQLQPEYGAWTTFLGGRVRVALAATPNVYPGPFRGGDPDIHTVFDNTLTPDGSFTRNLAIAYALTGDEKYAAKARQFILAWAHGNTPSDLTTYDSCDTGQMQSPGAFSLAYAYDLTYDSPLWSTGDRAAVAAYFTKFIAALRNCEKETSGDQAVRSGSTRRIAYGWDSSLTIRYTDTIIGGDFSMLMDAAIAAMAADVGDTATVYRVYGDKDNVLRVDNTLDHSLTSKNDGDKMGTTPAPQSHIYKSAIKGRGGTLDYCTYNARLGSTLAEMGENLGYGTLTTYRERLRATWLYLAKFFGPDALHSPNPYDSVNASVDVPRFAQAYSELGDPRLLDVLDSGNRANYYESQLLGPVTLTHSIAR